ncbi:MAG: NAD(P)-dependent oxidoreductase [Nitrospirae bacterium]|nr:NAD(P)-dependent oxidoreductase [Nitrospirota bacterium]
MKAVVFGGSGFLGSHVADALTDKGHEVTVFDLKPSPYISASQRMVVGDIMDEASVSESLSGADVVYNFAGLADIEEAKVKPLETIRFNVLGNTVLLECSRKAGVKRFVYASTLYVYSKTGSFYRSSKQASELIIENYYETFGLPYTILRYGSLYGPRSDERNWIYRSLKQALTEGKIVRHGDGEEIREYIHVKDAAVASVDILSNEFLNQTVIITGYQQIKIKELMLMIKEMLENKISLEFLPPSETYHYEITPYTFAPRVGKRLVSKSYHDLGQGIMECLYDIYKKVHHYPTLNGLVIKDEKAR